jgi:pimeloyl-ACP methyl ester carboxylesterase
MSFPPARRVKLPAWRDAAGALHEGIALSVHEAGDDPGLRPAVVLCHGFPELAYSWRLVITALVEAGFRVLAPDQRGYGASDCPAEIAAYGIEHLAADLAGLLDALAIERAVFAGHDWGGFVAWTMPRLHPARTAGVIGVNTPYVPFPVTSALRRVFADDERLYILWFQKPGVAEAVLDAQPRLVFEKLMCRPAGPRAGMFAGAADANPFRRIREIGSAGPPLLSTQEIDTYAAAFEKTGFAGGIHWYRNIDANAERWPGLGIDPIDLPCLMITAEWDPALPPALAAGMERRCSDLETAMIDRCGHWTQQEQPEQLGALMIDWLARRFGRA